MSNYTLELRNIVESCNMTLFDFPYNFYDETLKTNFEQKFINHFYFDEIGFETVPKFKHRLMTKLNDIYPYYKQLYETELACKDINFMLNKDLKETFIRELTNTSTMNNNSEGTSTSNSNGEGIGINSDTPQSSVDDIEKYMSNASKNINNNTSTSSDTNNSSSSSENNGRETTELLSQGNIGVTSSAELLQKWRDVLINIDMLMFEELSELFMSIY